MKIRLIKYALLFVMVVLLFSLAFYQNDFGPSPPLIITGVVNDQRIIDKFGKTKDANVIGSKRTLEYSFSRKESTWSGTSFIDLTGEKASGTIKVLWQKSANGPLVIFSIEEVNRQMLHSAFDLKFMGKPVNW